MLTGACDKVLVCPPAEAKRARCKAADTHTPRTHRCHQEEAVQQVFTNLAAGQTDRQASHPSDGQNAADLKAQGLLLFACARERVCWTHGERRLSF
jgi:hypothetical protein